MATFEPLTSKKYKSQTTELIFLFSPKTHRLPISSHTELTLRTKISLSTFDTLASALLRLERNLGRFMSDKEKKKEEDDKKKTQDFWLCAVWWPEAGDPVELDPTKKISEVLRSFNVLKPNRQHIHLMEKKLFKKEKKKKRKPLLFLASIYDRMISGETLCYQISTYFLIINQGTITKKIRGDIYISNFRIRFVEETPFYKHSSKLPYEHGIDIPIGKIFNIERKRMNFTSDKNPVESEKKVDDGDSDDEEENERAQVIEITCRDFRIIYFGWYDKKDKSGSTKKEKTSNTSMSVKPKPGREEFEIFRQIFLTQQNYSTFLAPFSIFNCEDLSYGAKFVDGWSFYNVENELVRQEYDSNVELWSIEKKPSDLPPDKEWTMPETFIIPQGVKSAKDLCSITFGHRQKGRFPIYVWGSWKTKHTLNPSALLRADRSILVYADGGSAKNGEGDKMMLKHVTVLHSCYKAGNEEEGDLGDFESKDEFGVPVGKRKEKVAIKDKSIDDDFGFTPKRKDKEDSPDINTTRKKDKTSTLAVKNKQKLLQIIDTGSPDYEQSVIEGIYGEICNYVWLRLPTIEDLSEARNELFDLCVKDAFGNQFYENMAKSKWSQYEIRYLKEAYSVAHTLQNKGLFILQNGGSTHYDDYILVPLIELLVDPFFRTLEGFCLLVEKEWVSYSFPFSSLGHVVEVDDPGKKNEKEKEKKEKEKEKTEWTKACPPFEMFINCVWQILQLQPITFEFTEEFLLFLLDSFYENRFGTFFFDNESARRAHQHCTVSIWSHVLSLRPQNFINQFWVSNQYKHTILPLQVPEVPSLWLCRVLRFNFESLGALQQLHYNTQSEERGLFRASSTAIYNDFDASDSILDGKQSEGNRSGTKFSLGPSPIKSGDSAIDLKSIALIDIPTDFCNSLQTFGITELNLRQNRLSVIPSALAHVKSLKKLTIEENLISEVSPLISFLSNLEHLSLDNNKILKIPEFFKSMENLTELSLAKNFISVIPAELGKCTRLKSLNLSNNVISELHKDLRFLRNLETLDISNNTPLSSLPYWIAGLPLIHLNVSQNRNLSELPVNLLKIKDQLETLDISSTTVQASIGDKISSENSNSILESLSANFNAKKPVQRLRVCIFGTETRDRDVIVNTLAAKWRNNVPESPTTLSTTCATTSTTIPNTTISSATPAPVSTTTIPGSFISVQKFSLLKSELGKALPSLSRTPQTSRRKRKKGKSDDITKKNDSDNCKNSGYFSPNSNSTVNDTNISLSLWEFNDPMNPFADILFMSKRSIYVITFSLLNAQSEEMLDFWIQALKFRIPNATIVIAGNYEAAKDSKSFVDFDSRFEEIKSKYKRVAPNMAIHALPFSSSSEVELDTIRTKIENLILKAKFLSESFPVCGLLLEKAISDHAETLVETHQIPIMSLPQIQQLSDEYGIIRPEPQNSTLITSLKYMHDNGTILFYYPEEPVSKCAPKIVFADPIWTGQTIVNIINANSSGSSKLGFVRYERLPSILKMLPPKILPAFIYLLRKFELLFDFPENFVSAEVPPTSTPSVNMRAERSPFNPIKAMHDSYVDYPNLGIAPVSGNTLFWIPALLPRSKLTKQILQVWPENPPEKPVKIFHFERTYHLSSLPRNLFYPIYLLYIHVVQTTYRHVFHRNYNLLSS